MPSPLPFDHVRQTSQTRLSRRVRCGVLAAALATLGPLSGTAVAQPVSDPPAGAVATRPNILFIIADDWSYPHSGVDGMTVVRTPAIDRIAREGAHFRNAYVPSPSCSPCRAAILTGQTPNRLGAAAKLSGPLSDEHPRYPDLLAQSGYHVGFSGKGYGPAWLDEKRAEKTGTSYDNFDAFLQARPADAPFSYWFGSNNPHRPYFRKVTERRGVNPATVPVPAFLPDTPETRQDLADYYAEIAEFDDEVAALMTRLEQTGQADNTIVVVCGDNGMPFARAKTNLYDAGAKTPLMIRWPAKVKAGTQVDAFVNLADLAPTFLEVGGVGIPGSMNAVSLLPVLIDGYPAKQIAPGATVGPDRSSVFLVREQHVPYSDQGGYSSRAIRTSDYLYILNLAPDRWPAGPPEQKSGQFPTGFPDVDEGNAPDNAQKRGGGAKAAVVASYQRGERVGRLALDKRPAEELYDLRADPEQMNNVAGDPRHKEAKDRLSRELRIWMEASGDQGVAAKPK